MNDDGNVESSTMPGSSLDAPAIPGNSVEDSPAACTGAAPVPILPIDAAERAEAISIALKLQEQDYRQANTILINSYQRQTDVLNSALSRIDVLQGQIQEILGRKRASNTKNIKMLQEDYQRQSDMLRSLYGFIYAQQKHDLQVMRRYDESIRHWEKYFSTCELGTLRHLNDMNVRQIALEIERDQLRESLEQMTGNWLNDEEAGCDKELDAHESLSSDPKRDAQKNRSDMEMQVE